MYSVDKAKKAMLFTFYHVVCLDLGLSFSQNFFWVSSKLMAQCKAENIEKKLNFEHALLTWGFDFTKDGQKAFPKLYSWKKKLLRNLEIASSNLSTK